MSLKGLRDIKTHGTLASERRLVSVARGLRESNLHASGKIRNGSGPSEWSEWDNWNVKVFKKERPAGRTTIAIPYQPYLEERIRLYLVKVTCDSLEELHQAVSEGLLVATHEVERLETKLAELEAKRREEL